MKILLDARYSTRSGASSYIENLLPHLLEANTQHELVLLVYEGQPLPSTGSAKVIAQPRMAPWKQVVWDQTGLPALLRREGVYVCHCMKTLGPAVAPCSVVTVGHSITSPYRGEFPAGMRQRLYWNLLGRVLYRRSAAVIAVSHFVRDFLIEALAVSGRRVHVVGHGIDPRFQPPSSLDNVPRAAEEGAYVLCVGNLFPVKNQLTAVRAFAQVAGRFPGLKLKLAGGVEHPYVQQVRQAVTEAGLESRVEFLDFVPPDQLVGLMQGACLMLLPSLTEGASITLIEAMACGAPVLASNRGGIPEIGGEAVELLADPLDAGAWAERMGELLEDDERRLEMRRKGVERVHRFSWKRAAQETLAVYDSFAES